MNGFMLLVLVVLAGQVSQAGPAMPPSLNPVQPASMVTTPPPQTDYGWQINRDTGLLEYIVQISPAKAAIMQTAGKEDESIIPAVVAARVSRIIVRFGTDPIQSTPIEEVLKLRPVDSGGIADNLPLGRIKTLENGAGFDVQNVAGGAQPPALTPGIGTSLTDADTSLSDKMSAAVRDPDNMLTQNRTSPGSSFLQDAMGNRGAATAPAFPSATGNNYSQPGSGLPTSTATTPPLAPGYNNNLPANGQPGSNLGPGTSGTSGIGLPGMGTAGIGNTTNGLGANGLGTNGGYGQPHSTAPGGNFTSFPGQNNATLGQARPGFASPPLGTSPLNPNTSTGLGYNNNSTYGNSPNYPNTPGYSNNPNYTGTPNYNGTPNFAGNTNFPGTTGQSGSPGYQSPTYSPGYANTQTSPGFRTDPPSVLLADQRTAVPSTSNTNGVGGSRSTWTNRTDGYPSDSLNDFNNQLGQRTGMENVMPVMFVLSLVVNFYLGMLIRKLLGRYRTLLSSVRSQTI